MSALDRLPSLLLHLAALPSPAQVVRALELGVFASFGMRAGMIWRLSRSRGLVLIAARGHTPQEEARHALFPIHAESPLGVAVREDRVDVIEAADFDRFHLTELDEQLWRAVADRHRMTAVVTAPVRFAGAPVGAFQLVLDRPWAPASVDARVLDAVTDALGLWLTHPESGCSDVLPPASVRAWSLSFTERQCEVLRLAGRGLTTRKIAETLVVSESTVKQDLRLAMSALRVRDRRLAAARASTLGLL